MQKPDKSPEPSMEEILASIRKIIAEEPLGSRAGPFVRPPGPDVDRGGVTSSSASISNQGEPGGPAFTHARGIEPPPYSVDESLADLMDAAPGPFEAAPPRAAPEPSAKPRPVAAEEPSRPGWLFGRAAATPAPGPALPAAPVGAFGPRAGVDPPVQLEEPRLDARPYAAKTDMGPLEPASAKPLVQGPVRGSGSVGGPLPADHDPTVARRPQAGFKLEVPRAPGAEHQAGISRADAQAPAGSGSPEPAAVAPRATQPRAAIPTQAPMRASDRVVGPAAADKPEKTGDRAPSPSASGSGAGEAQPAVGARAASTASAAGTQAGRPSTGVAAPTGPIAAAASTGTPATRTGSASGREARGSGTGSRTLEDTVADLLRPMLRDWLDANMPRIVEKALRHELAAGSRPPGGDQA